MKKKVHPITYYWYWPLVAAFALTGWSAAGEFYYRWADYVTFDLIHLNFAVKMMAESSPRPETVLPLTLVAIDDATATRWECPNTTPLDKLAALLTTITKAKPAAVVVDVDLSNPCGLSLSGEKEMANFLNTYAGDTPLVFVKRIVEDANGRLMTQPSHFDQALATNRQLSWAHAVYAYDRDGIARRWIESVGVCTEADVETMPSIPVRVLSVAQWRKPTPFARPAANLEHNDTCTRQSVQSTSHIVMFEHPDQTEFGMSAGDLIRMPAWQILDREIQRDDARLLFDRVVVIGNSHRSAGDTWHSPVGEITGVELIAQTIRFAAEQMNEGSDLVKYYGIALFIAYCSVGFFLRPIIASFLGIIITWIVVWVAVGSFGFFSIADSVEHALLLSLGFFSLVELLELSSDLRAGPRQLLLSEHYNNKHNHSS